MSDLADRSLELQSNSDCPDGFYPWEQALVLLVRESIDPAGWHAPYERDRSTGWLRPVGAQRRKELIQQCRELRCDAGAWFNKADVHDVLKRFERTPRWKQFHTDYKLGNLRAPFCPWRKKGAESCWYLGGKDAAELLLHQRVPHSDWPDIYVAADVHSEPAPATDRAGWVRKLFWGEEVNLPVFMLEHEVHKVVQAEQIRAAIRAAAELKRIVGGLTMNNQTQNTIQSQFEDNYRAQQLRVAAARAVSLGTTGPLPAAPAHLAPASAPVAVARRRARAEKEWHTELQRLVAARPSVDAAAALSVLSSLDGYDQGEDEDGQPTLLLPGSGKVTLHSIASRLSKLRP